MLHVDCLDLSISRGQIDHCVKQVCSHRQVHAAASGLSDACANSSTALMSTACQMRIPKAASNKRPVERDSAMHLQADAMLQCGHVNAAQQHSLQAMLYEQACP